MLIQIHPQAESPVCGLFRSVPQQPSAAYDLMIRLKPEQDGLLQSNDAI